jgi:DNA/RNA endonuclease YhcR with UshA esterase domain
MTVAIGDLHEGLIGSQVQVAGLVDRTRRSASGLSFDLYDPLDGSRVAVFVPEKVYSQIQEGNDISPGAEVIVEGTLQLYRGKLEILVTYPEGIRTVRPG